MGDQSSTSEHAQGGGESHYRNWSAILDLMPGSGPHRLKVRGEYHLNMRSGWRRLEKAVPQGFNPRILLINVVDERGDGGDWIPLEGDFDAKEGQYDSVELRDGHGEAHSVPVQEVH